MKPLPLLLKSPIHFIGIGGSGMAPLAELCIYLGYKVSGSDLKDTQITKRLESLGAKIFYEHKKTNLLNVKTAVYSSAILQNNEELLEAKSIGINLLHRSDLLSTLTTGKKLIAVSGTHGKTTSAGIIIHMLNKLGLDPSAAIGGIMLDGKSPCRFGKGELFVAEIDESDGSILKFKPEIGIITNIDMDHMEYFKDIVSLKKTFYQFLKNISPDEGLAILGWDNKLVRDIAISSEVPRLGFGFAIGCDIRAINYKCLNKYITFTAIIERDQIECKLPMIGRHNVLNALCALSVARHLDLDIKKAAENLETYKGVKRRLNLVFENKDIKIFDDYAHNPGKIRACINSLKEAMPNYKLHVFYQPHRYSRLKTMFRETVSSFKNADKVFVSPVYAAGEPAQKEFNPEMLAENITKYSQTTAVSFKNNLPSIFKSLTGPSIFLSLGAGDIWRVAEECKNYLESITL